MSLLKAIDEAFGLLPSAMDSREARHLMLAIGWQESRFENRRQLIKRKGVLVPEGPAMGFWQFEMHGGTRGVLTHDTSRFWARKICEARGVQPRAQAVWRALENDDVLAASFARLLLFTDPRPLPQINEDGTSWLYYRRNWQPGQPHPETWGQATTWATHVIMTGALP